jgi:hypothetical protein
MYSTLVQCTSPDTGGKRTGGSTTHAGKCAQKNKGKVGIIELEQWGGVHVEGRTYTHIYIRKCVYIHCTVSQY